MKVTTEVVKISKTSLVHFGIVSNKIVFAFEVPSAAHKEVPALMSIELKAIECKSVAELSINLLTFNQSYFAFSPIKSPVSFSYARIKGSHDCRNICNFVTNHCFSYVWNCNKHWRSNTHSVGEFSSTFFPTSSS